MSNLWKRLFWEHYCPRVQAKWRCWGRNCEPGCYWADKYKEMV